MADASEAVLVRLRRLEEQLDTFLEDRPARLLCWVVAPDEERWLEAFLALESERTEARRRLVTSDEPFRARGVHGVELVRALETAARERASTLARDGTYDVPWTAPSVPRELARKRGEPPPDLVYLCDALSAWKDHELEGSQTLVLCLRPAHVADLEAYARWLSDLGFLLAERDQRVVAVASSERNFGPALALANPERVRLTIAALDVPGALREIAEGSEDAGEPSGRYRRNFIEASNAVAAGDLEAALAPAERARHVAREENWSHLEFAVHQLLASGALGLGDLRRAFVGFDDAEKATHHDIRFGATWLSPLLLQARLGKGAVAMTGHAWKLGARLFADEALPVARALADRKSELECLRLASYCEERAGDEGRARAYAEAALATGRDLPAEERRFTTLAYVGEALLRLTRGLAKWSERAELERNLAALLGKDWRELTKPGTASVEDVEAFAERLTRAGSEQPRIPEEEGGQAAPATRTEPVTLTGALTATLTAALDLPLLDPGTVLRELPERAPRAEPPEGAAPKSSPERSP